MGKMESQKKNKSDVVEEEIIEGKKVSNSKRTLILFNISVTTLAGGIMATSLTTALPPIMRDLNIDINTAQWLTGGFGLFLAIVTPFTAFLIKRFRTKRLYLTALLLFMVGLIICAISNSFWIMMIGRVVQGCGTGLMSSMSQVIILNIYPPERIGTAMGWYGFSFSIGPIFGPTLAGVIVDTIGWRMIFVFTTIVMAVAFIMAIFIMEDVLPLMKRRFDTISLIISAFSFGGVTLAIGNIGKYDFVSYEVLMVLIIGLIATVIFVHRQLHQKLPFLDLRILKDKCFCVSTIAAFVLQLTILGNSIILPIYVQQIKGQSATISGLVILPGSIVSSLISPISGKLYDKIGIKLLYLSGSLSVAVSGLLIYFLNFDTSIWVMSTINILRCVGIAIFNMPVFTWGMRNIPKNRTSDASALSNSIRSIGGALGSAMFVSILTKVSNIVADTKEHPDMFGYNIVYLIMSILAFLIFFAGIITLKKLDSSDTKGKNEKELKKDSTPNLNDVSTIEMKDITTEKDISNKVNIVVEKENLQNGKDESETDTVINLDSTTDNFNEIVEVSEKKN